MSNWPHQSGRLAMVLALVAFFALGWYEYGFLNAVAASIGGLAAGMVIGNATVSRS